MKRTHPNSNFLQLIKDELQRTKTLEYFEFKPDFSAIIPLMRAVDLSKNGSSYFEGSKQIDAKVYSKILRRCQEYDLIIHINNLAWFAFDIGTSKNNQAVESLGKFIYDSKSYQSEQRKIIDNYNKNLNKTKLLIKDNYSNSIFIEDSNVIKKIFDILNNYIPKLSSQDEQIIKAHKKPGKRRSSDNRDRTAYYIFSYLKRYCHELPLKSSYIFIYHLLEAMGFPFESKKEVNQEKMYDAVRKAINRFEKK